MIPEAVLEIVECALSRDNHIASSPMTLSCGHVICKNCIPTDGSRFLKCNLCNEINDFSLNSSKESFASRKIFFSYINELFDLVKERFKDSICKLKDSEMKFEELLDLKIEYVRDEIEVRIESLRNDLDNLQQEMNIELNNIKEKMLKEKTTFNDTFLYEKRLNELENYIRNEEKKSESNFYEFQNEIVKVNEAIDDALSIVHKLKFNISEFKIDLKCIGEINYTNNDRLFTRLRSKTYKTIYLNVSASDVCELPNGNLLVSSYNNSNITIYDKNFKLIRVVDRINGQSFNPLSAATNDIDKVYISHCQNNRIIMTDIDLNFIKYSTISTNDFGDPYGICYFNSFVYVCDYRNRRIHKFNSQLEQHVSYVIDIDPRQIQIIGNLACIRNSRISIGFYDLKTFQFKHKYTGHGGDILALNSNFIEHSSSKNAFCIFDKNGKLIEDIKTDGLSSLITDCWYDFYGMTYFNGCLVLTTRDSKKLIVI